MYLNVVSKTEKRCAFGFMLKSRATDRDMVTSIVSSVCDLTCQNHLR